MLQALSRLVAGLGIICTALCVDAGELASLELETNGLVYDSLHNLIYATVPGSVPKVGNHVVALDPETLEVVDLVYVGSDPNVLDLSDSGQTLYVGLGGSPHFVRIDTTTLDVTDIISLGVTEQGLPRFAQRMQVQPGTENIVAVVRTGSLAIYDNGVARPATVPNSSTGPNKIAFSDDPSRLYGFDSFLSSNLFFRLTVSSSGVAINSSTQGLLSGSVEIVYGGGRVYSTLGTVIDPEGLTVLGTLPERGPTIPDPEAGKIHILNRVVSPIWLFTCDPLSFEITESTEYPYFGRPHAFARWGDSGVAFATDEWVVSLRTSQVWNDLHVPAATLTPLRGAIVSGGVSELSASDDQRIVVRPGPVFTTQQSPISLEVTAVSPSTSEEHMAFTIESHATSASIRQSVYLFDFVAQSYVLKDERQCATTDAKIKIEVWDDAARFIDSSGFVKARVDYRANGPVFSYPWQTRIDLARWTFIDN